MPELSATSDPEVYPYSHMFMLRLWREDLGEGRVEWRGKVQHVLSGETRYFRKWADLITFVREHVGDTNNSATIG